MIKICARYPGLQLRYHKFLLCLLVFLTLMLTGCGGELITRPDTQQLLFLLENSSRKEVRLNSEGPTLLINTVRATAGFDGSGMIYVTQPHQLQVFARHRWADSPSRMLEPLLLTTAEQSGLFSHVISADHQAQTKLRLDAKLLRLQQVFTDKNHSYVEIAMRITLVDRKEGRILATHTLKTLESTEEATPYSGVLAANRAVGRLSEELHDFFTRALTQY